MHVYIAAKPIINLSASNNNNCVPVTVRYTANVIPTKGYYEWNSVDFDTTLKSGLDHFYTTGGVKKVKFKFVSDSNCVDTSSIVVNLKPSPIADFLMSKSTTTMLDPQINLSNQTVDNIGNTYAWAVNNNYFDNQYNSQYTFGRAGEFSFTMKVTNTFNCSDSISKNITVTQQPLLFVPTAINFKSGVVENRKLIAKSFAIKSEKFNLYVYDRWGKEVFKTNDLNFSWGGNDGNNSKLCEPGLYVWKADYVDANNTSQNANGSFTILR
jgi:CHU_C Type IX secretion signal domain